MKKRKPTQIKKPTKTFQCLENGWPERGSREFWPFYYYPHFPSLNDIFEDNGKLKVILSTHLLETHPVYKSRMKELHSSTWALFFHESNETENRNSVVNKIGILTKPVRDKEVNIIKLIFTIPASYQNKYNFATIQRVSDKNLLKESFVEYRPINQSEPLNNPEYYVGQNEVQGGLKREKNLSFIIEMCRSAK